MSTLLQAPAWLMRQRRERPRPSTLPDRAYQECPVCKAATVQAMRIPGTSKYRTEHVIADDAGTLWVVPCRGVIR